LQKALRKRPEWKKMGICGNINEALFGLHDCHEKIKWCYVEQGKPKNENWVVEKDNFVKTFMLVGAISGRGFLPLIKIPSQVNDNADYYICHVLEPIFTIHIPKLYPGELDKVFVYHDMATSHTAKKPKPI